MVSSEIIKKTEKGTVGKLRFEVYILGESVEVSFFDQNDTSAFAKAIAFFKTEHMDRKTGAWSKNHFEGDFTQEMSEIVTSAREASKGITQVEETPEAAEVKAMFPNIRLNAIKAKKNYYSQVKEERALYGGLTWEEYHDEL